MLKNIVCCTKSYFHAVLLLMLAVSVKNDVAAAGIKGSNIVPNSQMISTGIVGLNPDGWSNMPRNQYVSWHTNAPERGGGRSVLFSNKNPDTPGGGMARILLGIFVEPGEKYLFKVWVRTRNFKAASGGLCLHSHRWRQSFGPYRGMPENSDWHEVAYIDTAPTGDGKLFSLTIYASKFYGEIELANPRIYPLSDKGIKAAARLGEDTNLIPVTPRPERIRYSKNAKLICRWYDLASMPSTGKVTYSIDKGAVRESVIGKDGLVTLDLANVPVGTHQLSMSNGKYSRTIEITILPALPAAPAGRYLNNLHCVLKDVQIPANGQGSFVNPDNGVILFSLPPGVKCDLNGVIFSNGDFQFLPGGEYKFKLIGGPAKVRISAISETMIYPLGSGPLLRGMKRLNLSFSRKYLIPYYSLFITHANYIPERVATQMLQKGHHRFFQMVNYRDYYQIAPTAGDMAAFLAKPNYYDRYPDKAVNIGTIIDETDINSLGQTARACELADLFPKKMPGKDFYNWFCGDKVNNNAATAEVLYRTGRPGENNRAVLEVYIMTKETEAEALAELEKRFESLRNFMAMSPETAGVNFGHCNLPLRLTFYHHPHVNFKYYLDLQFHKLANDPALKGMKLAGFWGDHYADREFSRFAAALVNHYVIQGKTELMTGKLGYNYQPDHLKNSNFTRKFANWESSGNITCISDHKFSVEHVVCLGALDGLPGDNIAVFTRGAKPNILKQRASGLVPGRVYSLAFISGNNKSRRGMNHANIDLSCTIEGAELLPEHTEQSHPGNKGKGNYDKIVFKATRSDPMIIFSDDKHPEGTQVYLSSVSLMPFFE